MSCQQSLRKAQKLIPQYKILILQYLIQQILQQHECSLRVHALQSILSRKLPSYHHITDPIFSFKHHSHFSHLESFTERYDERYTSKIKVDLNLSQSHIVDKQQLLILQIHNEEDLDHSPVLKFQQEKKGEENDNVLQKNEDLEGQNGQSLRYDDKYKKKEVNINVFNSIDQQISISDKNSQDHLQKQPKTSHLRPHKIQLSYMASIIKNVMIKKICSAFQGIQNMSLSKKMKGKRQKDLQRLLVQKEDYIFELQSDMAMYCQQLQDIHKRVRYYKKCLKRNHPLPSTELQAQETDHDETHHSPSKFIIQDKYQNKSIGSSRVQDNSKYHWSGESGELKGKGVRQFKLMYRVDEDEDDEVNSIKIELMKDEKMITRCQINGMGDYRYVKVGVKKSG